jgi:hypothetical protein
VAHYVATGAVELGFQQIGELIDKPGIAFLGPLPRGLATKEARALQAFPAAPAAGAVVRKKRDGTGTPVRGAVPPTV